MNTNSVYQKCDICKKKHKEIDDIYEWYSHYLDYNPKNVSNNDIVKLLKLINSNT